MNKGRTQMLIKLNNILSENLQWKKPRIDFLTIFITSLIKVKTVNLSEIAEAFDSTSKKESNYRRIQRFFADFELDYVAFAKLLISMVPEKSLTVIVDRTNWKSFGTDKNFFFLAVEYKGIGIPVLWKLLNKKGNTNTDERIDLLDEFVQLFGTRKIAAFLADREFVGKEWFNWLSDNQIPFMIRIKNNFLLEKTNKERSKAKNFFRSHASKEIEKELFDLNLKLIGAKIRFGDNLIVATNIPDSKLELYSKRWSIETMFTYFKSKGFNLEATKIVDPERLNKLVALLSLAFCWCIIVGEFFHPKQSRYREDLKCYSKSIFKVGFENLRRSLLSPSSNKLLLSKAQNLFIRKLQDFRKIVVE